MSNQTFENLFDNVSKNKNGLIDVFKRFNQQNPTIVVSEEILKENSIFQKDFSAQLAPILEHWLTDGTLNDEQKEIFQICAEFLLKLVKSSPKAKLWLNQQEKLIDLTEKCLNEIGSYGYYIGSDRTEDSSLDAFDKLVQSFEYVQCEKLLDVLTKCVTSRFYIEVFYQLSDVNAAVLTFSQHFLLVTCPNYIFLNDKNRSHCVKIAKEMLKTYDEIFDRFVPHVRNWTLPVIVSLVYPIRFILCDIQSIGFDGKKKIYEIIFAILKVKTEEKIGDDQGRIALIYNCLSLLFEIVRKNKKLLEQLKSKTPENEHLLQVLKDFSKHERDKIRLKALELVSLLVPEDEFLKEENKEKVTEFYIKNFNDAVGKHRADKVDEVLVGLRDLIQNDDVKKELMKQNGLPSIINYAKEAKDDPLPLEITYAMTFNPEAKKMINDDKEFVEHVKKVRESQEKRLAQLAHGIMWKLEGEEQFKKREEAKKQSSEVAVGSNSSSTEVASEPTDQYDMMISYCWAQKELCHRINDRLEKDGFSVWLDRDEMHGSIVEAMAEAIEKSRFILICMSSNYKKSPNCKAEAEYAFSKKSKIVPLIVEANYQADGWLGFLAGSKIYVDFADKEGEDFDKAYDLLIAELERNGLRDKKTDAKSKTEVKPTAPKPEAEKPKEPASPKITTTNYKQIEAAQMWEELHVAEFLTDQKLEAFLFLCEGMDGPTLIDFYQACQTAPDRMFSLINTSKEHPVSIGIFFKFLNRFKKYLPVVQPVKIDFRYNFVYPNPLAAPAVESTPKTKK